MAVRGKARRRLTWCLELAGSARPRRRRTRYLGMAGRLALTLSLAGAVPAAAQRPDTAGGAAADSGRAHVHAHGDTLGTPMYSLPAITITAARTQRQTPTSTVQVPREQVQRTLATSTSAWDLLRQAAGLEVHEQGQGPGFASDASIRGFSSDHSSDMALWVDGVPINEPVNGHAEGYNDWSLLFPESIQDIEVIKGPTSPLFGNFAMAGVVNVRTLERLSGSRAWLSGGSAGRREGSVLAGIDRPGTGAVLGLRGQLDDGWRPHAGWSLGQGYGRLVRDVSRATSVDLGASVYGTGWDSPGFITAQQFAARAYDVVASPTDGGSKLRGQERASVRVLLGSSLLWRTTVYSTQSRWSLFLTTPPEGGQSEGTGSQVEEEDRRWGAGLTSALTLRLPRTELTVGTQDRLEHADYQNWFTTARVRDSADVLVGAGQTSGGLFLESTSDVGRHIRLSVGGRWDVLQDRSRPRGAPAAATSSEQATSPTAATKGILSPKLGALWHLPKLASLYVSVSRGFRDPDGIITEPALPFITEWAYEGGVKLDAAWGEATVSAFRMDVSDEQTFDPVTLRTTSGGASRRRGIELEGAMRPLPALTVSGDWTFDDARYLAFVTPAGDTLAGAPIFNTARYVGSLAADLAPPRARWDVRLAASALGPYTPFDEPGVTVPAYALLHLAGGCLVAGVRVETGVRNLLDHAYPELRAGGFVSPGQPRSVYVTVSRRFGS